MVRAAAPSLGELCSLPVSVSTLVALESYDPARLSDEQQVLYLRACQRAEAHFAGRRLASVARLARDVDEDGLTLGQRATVAEVGVALRIAPGSAVNEIHRARRLAGDLPAVLAGMIAGELTYCHGLAVLDATRTVDNPLVLDAVLAGVLPAAAETSPGVLARAVRRLVARLDPAALERRHAAARQAADVTLDPTDDAMGYLTAYLPLPDAIVIRDRVEDAARTAKAAGDLRPLGVLRCQALLEFTTTGGGAGSRRGSTSHGRPVELHIAATPDTLLGLSDLPGEIPGVGPIPASLVRDMARDAALRWLTISATNGRLLDYAPNTYRVPTAMAAQVNTTWVHSIGPHCTVPATRCDLDHIVPHPQGPTAPCNLAPQDRRTHNAKTHHGLTLHHQPGGELEWTTPLGQTLTIEPWDYRLCESDP